MENKIKDLKDFNEAMFKRAFEEKRRLENEKDLYGNNCCTDIEVFRFDFDGKKSEPVDESDHEPSADMIEYYWLEYERGVKRKKRMKLALFFQGC